MHLKVERPAALVHSVHAEPDHVAGRRKGGEAVGISVPWLARWQDGEIRRYASAIALLRAVLRRDRRAAEHAERRGVPSIIATVITWSDIPPGFVPPRPEDV
jgi:hypothetical protein